MTTFLLATLAAIVGLAALAPVILWRAWLVPQCCPDHSGCTPDRHSRDGICDYAPGGRLTDTTFLGFIRDLRAACAELNTREDTTS